VIANTTASERPVLKAERRMSIYPHDFQSWPEKKRNEWFAAEARAYREAKTGNGAADHAKPFESDPFDGFVSSGDRGISESKWPEPRPLPDGLLPVAAFDPAFLPEAIAPWIMDISDRMQCPPEFVAISGRYRAGRRHWTQGCDPAPAQNRLVRSGEFMGLHRRTARRFEIASNGRSAEAASP
jgi:hypothetical protein